MRFWHLKRILFTQWRRRKPQNENEEGLFTTTIRIRIVFSKTCGVTGNYTEPKRIKLLEKYLQGFLVYGHT